MRHAAMLVVVCACGDNLDPDIGGPHKTYVMSHQLVPATSSQAREYGLDLGSPNGTGPDGRVDNQMGMVLSTLSGLGTETQMYTDRLIDRGELLQLIDTQIPEPLDLGAAAGLATYVGTNPRPTPCASAEDQTCRQHLQGSGVFDIDPSSSQLPPVPSLRADSTYVGGPGALSVMTGFFDELIQLDLVGARVSFAEPAETLTGVIAGGVTHEQVHDRLLPAIVRLATNVVRRDCVALDMPPACGCAPDTTGKTLLALFDVYPTQDCAITVDEVANNSLVVSLARPDIRIDGIDLLSFGFRFEAVQAEVGP